MLFSDVRSSKFLCQNWDNAWVMAFYFM